MDDKRKKQIIQNLLKKMTLNHYIYSEEYHMFNTSNFPFTDVDREQEQEHIISLLKANDIKFEVKEDETIHIFAN